MISIHPTIEGADEEVRELTYSMAHGIYGEQLPEIIEARIEKELKSIIGHGFAVIYLISHKLVKKSLDDGLSCWVSGICRFVACRYDDGNHGSESDAATLYLSNL